MPNAPNVSNETSRHTHHNRCHNPHLHPLPSKIQPGSRPTRPLIRRRSTSREQPRTRHSSTVWRVQGVPACSQSPIHTPPPVRGRTAAAVVAESRSGGGGGWLAEATRTGHRAARSFCRATIYHPHYHPDPSPITADGAAALSAARPRARPAACGRCVRPLLDSLARVLCFLSDMRSEDLFQYWQIYTIEMRPRPSRRYKLHLLLIKL